MILNQWVGPRGMIRLMGMVASLGLCFFIGCGNMGGCQGGVASDLDGDGVFEEDNCPLIANADQTDTDGDEVGDVCDNCIFTANADQADADSDDIGDVCEDDRDNDGILNADDNCLNVPNADQADGDDDGIGDVCDNSPGRPNPGQEDADGDGVGDASDNCVDDANADQTNSDGDTHGDACDNCVNADNEDQADADNNGAGDVCDGDRDSDTIPDDEDNCPDDANTDQANNDGDTLGDACDNCPNNTNQNQTDTDNDDLGDACDNINNNVPVTVNITGGTGQTAFPCGTLNLSVASTDPEDATIVWTITSGSGATFTDNGGGSATAIFPPSASATDQFKFTATGSALGFANGSATVTVTMNAYDFKDIVTVATKSSGAAQPGDAVSIDLADSEDAEWQVSWKQDAADSVDAGAITMTGQVGSFTAPSVSESTSLNFNATGCRADNIGVGLTGTVAVEVQVVSAVFNLPASVVKGGTVQLDASVTLTGEPATFELLFFTTANGALPSDVLVSINQDTNVLTVDINSVDYPLVITVQIIGTAGQLDELTDTINIVPPPS